MSDLCLREVTDLLTNQLKDLTYILVWANTTQYCQPPWWEADVETGGVKQERIGRCVYEDAKYMKETFMLEQVPSS